MRWLTSVAIAVVGVITGISLVLILAGLQRRPNVGTVHVVQPLSVKQNVSLQPIKTTVMPNVQSTSPRLTNPYLGQTTSCHGKTFQITLGNIFLYNVICNVTQGNDIVQFSGPRISKLFDTENSQVHAALPGNNKYRRWGDVAKLISQTQADYARQNITNRAVHLHNYHKLGDFMLLFRDEYMRAGPDRKNMAKGGPNALPLTAPQFNWAADKGQPPVVLTNWGDENWGFLSGPIATRTTKWLNMTNHLKIHISNYNTVRMLLDSDKLTLLVCNTHVEPGIGNHTKIISIPLGIKARQPMFSKALKFLTRSYNKTSVLQINNSGWGDRKAINAQVSAAFNHSVKNTYSTTGLPNVDHHFTSASAQFVLCPSGLGFDTYRLWETILTGSVPIVESNPGFDRTYSNLPVLVVRNFSDVTPQLLHRAYPCFVQHAHLFNYRHLTESYWMELVRTAIRTGSIVHVTREHPFRNKYCDFL